MTKDLAKFSVDIRKSRPLFSDISKNYLDRVLRMKESFGSGVFSGADFYTNSELLCVIEEALKIFWSGNRFFPSLESPSTFNEFIFKRKFLEGIADPQLASKTYLNRFVSRALGSGYTSEIVFEAFNLDRIEDVLSGLRGGVYFLKSDNGSGTNFKFVIDDNTNFECLAVKLKEVSTPWLDSKFGFSWGEWQYSTFRPCLFIERSLTPDLVDPFDYRFFCFGGRVEIINVDSWGYGKKDRKVTFLNRRWDILEMKYPDFDQDLTVCRPVNMDNMIEIAEKLAGSVNKYFLRVDMYNIDGAVIIGELTFTPTNGFRVFEPSIYNYILGSFWANSVG